MWDPEQYRRFAAVRRRPFEDLLARVQLDDPGVVVDLGCGTGEGTTLRPILSALGPVDGCAFLEALGPLLREDYPATARGTPFLFRRRFVVARKGLGS